jgi:hypothetical protein
MSVVGHMFEARKENHMPDNQTTSLPEIPYASPPLSTSREHLVRASDHLWRVLDRSERVLGHLRIVADPLGLRYRAERLHLATGTFRIVGEFWRPDDAVSALRYS